MDIIIGCAKHQQSRVQVFGFHSAPASDDQNVFNLYQQICRLLVSEYP